MILKSNKEVYQKNFYALGDAAIVRELGANLKQMRINKNMSQQQLADTTGLDRVTISRFENGRAATLLTFTQLLRALGRLELLQAFKEEPEVSPLLVAEMEEQYRKRASSKRKVIAPQRKPSEW